MWNPVSRVAKDMFLPEAELVAFAQTNAPKYSIDNKTKGDPWVGNWHVDRMLNDFKTKYPELCERVYAEKISAMRAENAKRKAQ